MLKRIVAVLLLVCLAASLPSCSMKTAKALFGAIADVFGIGNDPKPDPADHECVFKPEGGDRVKLVKCSVEGCGNYGRPDDDGKYTKLFNEYKDFEDRKDEIFTFCDKYLENLSKVDRYDPEKHAYEEGSKLEKESEKAVAMSDKLEEYYHYVSDVYSVVELFYYSDVSEYGELYRAAEDFSDEFEKKYYEIEIAAYECAYRNYLFPEEDGWTEESLEEEIEYAEVHSKDELLKLVDAVQEVSYKIDQIPDTRDSDEVCALYAELVEANNALAHHLGYGDYYDYAMENEYGREYSRGDIEAFTSLVKEHLPSVMWDYYYAYSYSDDYSYGSLLYTVLEGSFFDDPDACDAVYSFLKSIEKVQGEDEESYYGSANDALKHGNVVYSDSENAYDTAYTDYLYGLEIPVLYFSEQYSDVQSFIHEHGHYHAALTDSADQVSYDFNEIQSQGAELMYTAHLKDYLAGKDAGAFDSAATEMLAFDLLTVVYSLADDEFERAVYSGNYEGIEDPDGKLSDGVDPDEYDYLYACILRGYDFEYGDNYWRNTVTKSPCYYVSYAVSMVVSLEIFAEAVNKGYDEGAKAYLALFSAPVADEYEEREGSDIEFYCEYAGLCSPFEEEAYGGIVDALNGLRS